MKIVAKFLARVVSLTQCKESRNARGKRQHWVIVTVNLILHSLLNDIASKDLAL